MEQAFLTRTSKKLCKMLNLDYPIIQAGMVWVSGAKLAAAAARAGVLGVIGSGSMSAKLLQAHIKKAKTLTNKKFAVNLPLLYSGVRQQIDVALEENINIFITSAGSPKIYTKLLKDSGAKVLHVVSHPELAKKCEQSGVDAVIAEGFEAGGHNGRAELSTMCLVPAVVDAVSIPVIAAGGIATGGQMLAALCLGAHGVQMGSRFLATQESSAHINFKSLVVNANSDSTKLCMKSLVPVRLLKNTFFSQIEQLENKGAPSEEIATLLGKGRAKLGMLEGKIDQGELELGQVCNIINNLPSTKACVQNIIKEYNTALHKLNTRSA
jgi:enoyl-[acyl-carrier protein] reductase II